MNSQNSFDKLVSEAKLILSELEVPFTISEDKAAIILICLADITLPGDWKATENFAHTPNESRPIDPISKVNFHGIQKEAIEKFGYKFPDREEIRRKALHHFEAVGFVIYNQDEPQRNTPNSIKNNYRLTDKAKVGLRKFGTKGWENFVKEFEKDKIGLKEALHRKRERKTVEINFKDRFGKKIGYSASGGKHSEIEQAIITQFPQHFIKNPTTVLYIDDTASGEYRDYQRLQELNIELNPKGKLPDVILYDEVRGWFFLFEAVVSHGPIDETRLKQLIDLFPSHKNKLIFVTVFETLKSFGKSVHQIAFDTEIWVADKPEHLIHYNGDRFLGPRNIEEHYKE